MYEYGDKVRINPESTIVLAINMDMEDLYQIESRHMDFSFGSGPTEMYRIKNIRTGTIDKVVPSMIKYDIAFLRKQKIEKICSKLEI